MARRYGGDRVLPLPPRSHAEKVPLPAPTLAAQHESTGAVGLGRAERRPGTSSHGFPSPGPLGTGKGLGAPVESCTLGSALRTRGPAPNLCLPIPGRGTVTRGRPHHRPLGSQPTPCPQGKGSTPEPAHKPFCNMDGWSPHPIPLLHSAPHRQLPRGRSRVMRGKVHL